MTRSVTAPTGALIMIAMRWTDRMIGMLSTIILARLLVPEDYGIIAMASLVIGLVDVLLDMGVNTTLIQNANAVQEDYDAAWTLRLIQAALASLLVLAVSGHAADYFHDSRVTSVIQLLALSFPLAALENIGIVKFQKNMEFGLEFRFFFIKRISGFLLAVGAAWLMHNYWALVIGILGMRLTGTILSYVMHPMRPHLSFARMKAMISFSSWNLLRGIGIYLNESLHRFLVGRRESSNVMGAYSMGSEVAALPSTELLAPLSRVLFPIFVKLKHDLPKLKEAFLLALSIQAVVGMPAGTGLAVVSPEMVLVLLGDKWVAAIPFVQIMGAINIVIAISTSGGYVLLALGRAKITALNAWLQVLMFAAIAALVIPKGGAMAIALLRLAVAVCGLFAFFYLIKRELPSLRVLEILNSVWRPSVASALMVIVLLTFPGLDTLSALAQLILRVSIGAIVFCASLLLLWRCSGCPDGAENYLLKNLKGYLELKR